MLMGLRSIVLMELIILLIIVLAVKATIAEADNQAKPGCPSKCGDVTIPYPFGTGGHCNFSKRFYIKCDNASKTSKAFFAGSNIQVLNISLDGQLRVLANVSYDCYDSSGPDSYNFFWIWLAWFPVNNIRNKFTAIGCDTYAVVRSVNSTYTGVKGVNAKYATGCLSLCNISYVTRGSCSGIGCCQTAIPKGVKGYNVTLDSYLNHSNVLPDNPCSYAFVAEDGAYNFSISDLNGYDFRKRRFPVILDWTIGNISCREAKDMNKYACKENSECVDSENSSGSGYLCKCIKGYDGNPYLSNGCRDINECESKTLSLCHERAICQNSAGNHTCSCPEGYKGDGWKNGTGCSRHNTSLVIIFLVTGMGFLVLVSGILLLCLMLRQRQISKLRERYFEQNGGTLLLDRLSQRQRYGDNVKMFAAKELEKATNSYHESTILGQGGQGTVYKGTLLDGRVVAIKKSRIGDQSQVEPFINEIIVLYRINHRNVVKLLGCCLETPVPLLVYEYVTNGTLFDHMHNVSAASFLPWEARLRIAVETAEALSYLHSAVSIPVIHRDIKLANILLDENYTAKVSDFGASRLISSDQAEVTTLVQGTFGYLDPEYMQTGQLTEKSDVYSFGVVLIELLTGQKVICSERSEENKVLPMYFVSLMKEGKLLEIIDPGILNDGNIEHLKEVATLAWRCVRVNGEERPTMKEVAHELEGLQAMGRHPWGKSDLPTEEVEHLLGDFYDSYGDGATSSSIGYDSINNKITFELEGAR